MNDRVSFARVLLVFGAGAVLVLGWMCMTSVPAGHVGVVTAFGKVENQTLEEGLHFVPFWKKVENLSLRTEERKEAGDVPTSEGLTAHLEVSLLFSLMKDRASEVFQKVGPKYAEVVVVPQFRSVLRGATTKYKSEDLYTANRAEIEKNLEAELAKLLEERGIRVERVLLRNVKLPEKIMAAIDQKVAADQKRLQLLIELQQAETEAKKKKVEAEGIKEAQRLITETLSEEYIRYLWVKALETAAQNRTTMIYVPTGTGGMPMVEPVRKPAAPASD